MEITSIRGGDLKHLYGMAMQDGVRLTDQERQYLFLHPFVIIDEDDFGFVTIEYYGDKVSWQNAWTSIEARVARFYEDAEEAAEEAEAEWDSRHGDV